MKIYHVYKSQEANEAYKVISPGWKWGAFWLGMFWFLYKKAYRTAAIFFLVLAAIIGIYEIFEIKASGGSLGLAVVAGMSGADYVEAEYKKKYVYCGDIEARNEKNAIAKFLLFKNR